MILKITRLEIKNFKAISNIDVSDLPNFVVIVGENGVGKSSVFDAISFVASQIGPLSSQESQWWTTKLLQKKNPIAVGKKESIIRIHVEPTTDEEKQITGNNTAVAGIRLVLGDKGNILPDQENTNNASELLRSWKRVDGVGGIEYIPANRAYMEGPVGLQPKPMHDEQFFAQRRSQLENKYHDAKQMFVTFFLHDALRPDEPKLFPEAKSLVESLLDRKIEIAVDSNMIPHIWIESKAGRIEIDSLSSGQRELFMTYVGMHSVKLTQSVILFDEPDLHLHTSMQKKALEYLQKYTDSNNQVFIATHSLDMIAETSEENLFRLSDRASDSQLCRLTDEKDKLSVFTKLGVSKHTFVNFRKIIFVEGETDYNIFRQMASLKPDIRFEQVGGVSKITPDILDKASRIESFFMIRDRDYLEDGELLKQEEKYRKKVRFLRRHSIENYILDSDELFEIYQKFGDDVIKSKDEMLLNLHKLADQQFEQTVVDCYNFRKNRDVHPPEIKLSPDEKAEDGICRINEIREDRINKSTNAAPEEISKIRTKLQSKWDKEWINYCNGKDILKKFCIACLSSKSLDEVRDLVSAKWDAKKKLPDELMRILDDISDNN